MSSPDEFGDVDEPVEDVEDFFDGGISNAEDDQEDDVDELASETTFGRVVEFKRAAADRAVDRFDARGSPGAKAAARAGEKVADVTATVARGWFVFMAAIYYVVLSKLPKTSGIGAALINAGHKSLQKSTKADAIVNVIYGDGVVIPRPATWQSEEMEFHTSNGECFSARGVGYDPKRVNGRTPVVWALRDAAEITEPLEAFIAQQRTLGNYDEPVGLRDGGTDVPIHATTDGAHGRVLSFRAGWQLFGSKVTQEDMEQQATRAKLSVLDWNSREGLYLALALGGGVALGLFGPALAASIAGSGGGGGIGGGIPSLGFGLINLAGVVL